MQKRYPSKTRYSKQRQSRDIEVSVNTKKRFCALEMGRDEREYIQYNRDLKECAVV